MYGFLAEHGARMLLYEFANYVRGWTRQAGTAAVASLREANCSLLQFSIDGGGGSPGQLLLRSSIEREVPADQEGAAAASRGSVARTA